MYFLSFVDFAELEPSDLIQRMARHVGVYFMDKGASVLDHVNHNATIAPDTKDTKAALGTHALVTSTQVHQTRALFPKGPELELNGNPILYRGPCTVVSPKSRTVFSAVWAEDTSYSWNPHRDLTKEAPLAGSTCSFVSLAQTKTFVSRDPSESASSWGAHDDDDNGADEKKKKNNNNNNSEKTSTEGEMINARTVVLGAADMITDRLLDSPVSDDGTRKAGNRQLTRALLEWLFHQRGELRLTSFTHTIVARADESGATSMTEVGMTNPEQYRIKDHVDLSVELEANVGGGMWAPYESDRFQISFVMLDPYVRSIVSHAGAGHYNMSFQVPDSYGVFKYVLDHYDPGFTHIYYQHVVGVRPYRHHEFPRFIGQAYPYYATAFVLIATFFLVTFSVLYS